LKGLKFFDKENWENKERKENDNNNNPVFDSIFFLWF